ncbi:hypothetical protein HK097_002258 [Rhizophlyctis rosea]|uniref:Uncharacterized protein n=1 Tax=Rhizophlyctis rosea TaxID=64517 RepID=A0AAD5S688_9FUNG|nr:hypothetical protein HK097_002258 [Rhizophlyctis rosea]
MVEATKEHAASKEHLLSSEEDAYFDINMGVQTDEELSASMPQGLRPYKPTTSLCCAFLTPIFLIVLAFTLFLTIYACTPTDLGWAVCLAKDIEVNGVYFHFTREDPPTAEAKLINLVFITPLVFLAIFFAIGVGVTIEEYRGAGRNLGMRHPMKKKLRAGLEEDSVSRKIEGYWAVTSSWVSVKEAKELIRRLRTDAVRTQLEAGGKAWYYDYEGDSRFRGRWFGVVPFGESEDCTESSDVKQLELILDRSAFEVLKIQITIECTPSSTATNDKISSLHEDFIKNFRSLIPISENDDIAEDDPAPIVSPPGASPSLEKKYKLETSTMTTFLDPVPEGDVEDKVSTMLNEKILFVYTGERRPGWTSARWYKASLWFSMSAVWERWVGSGYGELVKGVVIRKKVY